MASGPIIPLHLAVPPSVEAVFKKEEKAIPDPKEVMALIDTGATRSVIQEGLSNTLGLHPVGMAKIHTASHADVDCLTYQVRMILGQKITMDGTVIEAPLQGQAIQALIGRDILARCIFVYTGGANSFTLGL